MWRFSGFVDISIYSHLFFFFSFFFPCNQVWLHLSMFLIVSSL